MGPVRSVVLRSLLQGLGAVELCLDTSRDISIVASTVGLPRLGAIPKHPKRELCQIPRL